MSDDDTALGASRRTNHEERDSWEWGPRNRDNDDGRRDGADRCREQVAAIEATLEEVVMIAATVEREGAAKAVTVETETPRAPKALAKTKERKAIQMEKVMPAKETKVTAGKPTKERRALATTLVVGRTSLNTWVR